jgi:exonuclease VII small subunit
LKHETQSRLNDEASKYVGYITCLESKLVALNDQNKQFKEAMSSTDDFQSELRKSQQVIHQLLQMIALQGYSIIPIEIESRFDRKSPSDGRFDASQLNSLVYVKTFCFLY